MVANRKLQAAGILILWIALGCQTHARTTHASSMETAAQGVAPEEPESKNMEKTLPVLAAPENPPPPDAPPSLPVQPPAPDPACLPAPDANAAARMYPWPRQNPTYESACLRFPTPAGARRVAADEGSWAHWLRHLPLMPPGTPVRRYDGVELSWATSLAAAVADIDVGREDLQQCMDSLIRLRAEYHWSCNRPEAARFPYAGRITFGFDDWRRGLRPRQVPGRGYELAATAAPSDGRRSFEKYLRFVFAMTGTVHYSDAPAVPFDKLEPGDFFLEPSPSPQVLGHAILILDVARDPSGRTWALAAQGFTPAQDFHVLRASPASAWFELTADKPVQFPSWGSPFAWNQVHRFRH